MRTEPDIWRDRPDPPLHGESLEQAVVVVTKPLQEAANDDDAADRDEPEDRPNPLWAVNGALLGFLFVAALLLARG